jgi:hypothetical protein
MISPVDRLIEHVMKRALHIRRDKIIAKTLKMYRKNHPDAVTTNLEKDLQTEAARIYTIVDRSILSERIKRAKYTFWLTVMTSTVIVGALGGFTAGAALPFVAPPLAALSAWLIALATIPISYNKRIQGAMDSVVLKHEHPIAEIVASRIQTLLAELQSLTQNINQADASPPYTTTIAPIQGLNPVHNSITMPLPLQNADDEPSFVRFHYDDG